MAALTTLPCPLPLKALPLGSSQLHCRPPYLELSRGARCGLTSPTLASAHPQLPLLTGVPVPQPPATPIPRAQGERALPDRQASRSAPHTQLAVRSLETWFKPRPFPPQGICMGAVSLMGGKRGPGPSHQLLCKFRVISQIWGPGKLEGHFSKSPEQPTWSSMSSVMPLPLEPSTGLKSCGIKVNYLSQTLGSWVVWPKPTSFSLPVSQQALIKWQPSPLAPHHVWRCFRACGSVRNGCKFFGSPLPEK